MSAPKGHPNLTQAGEGRQKVEGKVKLTCKILAATKAWLQRNGKNKAGAEIDRLVVENAQLKLQIHALQLENEGLRDRLRGLSPTDLP